MPTRQYTTPPTYLMSVDSEHPDYITVRKRHNGKDTQAWRFGSAKELSQWADEEGINDDSIVMCSSTLDFPQEYTTNPTIINLANKLREL